MFSSSHYLLRGLILGLAIAIPVGPIGLLCIHRTLLHGRLHGFVSGLGAATADSLYMGVAAFGINVISQFLVVEQPWLRLVGGILLCYLGVRAFLAPTEEDCGNGRDANLWHTYVSSLLLTLSNPMTFLAFAAILAGLGLLSPSSDHGSAWWLVTGVFLGSVTWWFLLTGGTDRMRQRMMRHLPHINRISGAVIGGFGVAVLLHAV